MVKRYIKHQLLVLKESNNFLVYIISGGSTYLALLIIMLLADTFDKNLVELINLIPFLFYVYFGVVYFWLEEEGFALAHLLTCENPIKTVTLLNLFQFIYLCIYYSIVVILIIIHGVMGLIIYPIIAFILSIVDITLISLFLRSSIIKIKFKGDILGNIEKFLIPAFIHIVFLLLVISLIAG